MEKNSNKAKENSGFGITSLEEPWRTIVYLVGTFGLSVFLVVWYLVKIQPDEKAQYEKISTVVSNLSVNLDNLAVSVELLSLKIKEGQSLLTKNQGNNLKRLYIATVSNELNHEICKKLNEFNDQIDREKAIIDLADIIKKTMLDYAELIGDLVELEHNVIQAEIAKQIHGEEGVCKRIAMEAIDKWKNKTPLEVSEALKWSLKDSFSLTLKKGIN
jgi:hypothetical protein